jgi:hypothetical protein
MHPFNINNAAIGNLTGQVWFGIFLPAGNSSGATKFEFGVPTLTAK